MANWSEIRALANQLKVIQDDNSVCRISERTWVDIIHQLANMNRLKLIFSTDGRSYFTPTELDKEIREEVEINSGRITLNELASNIDVDMGIVESRVLELIALDAQLKSPCRLLSISNEIINYSYVRRIAQEILDKLEENGQISISELITMFSLPVTFISNLINEYQGTLYHVHKYGEKYITDTFLSATRSKIRGYFTAVTRPVTLNSVASNLQVPENVLGSIVSSLITSGRLKGNLVAARGTYVPTCHTQAEDDYVNSFFSQNGYVDWNYLKRFGIADPGSYLKSKFPKSVHVSGLTIGTLILDRLQDLISVVVRDSSWADLSHYVPLELDNKVLSALIDPLLKDVPVKSIENMYLVADSFVETCEGYFVEFINQKANFAFKKECSTFVLNSKRNYACETDSPTKRGSTPSKGGFGYGSREIKHKNVKKKYVPNKRRSDASQRLDDSLDQEDNPNSTRFMFENFVLKEDLVPILLSNVSNDIPEDIVDGILDLIMPSLERSFIQVINNLMLSGTNSSGKRENRTRTEEMINNMLFSIQILDRGIQAIDHTPLQKQLSHYLVKNHGSKIIEKLCHYINNEYGLSWTNAQNSNDPTPPNHLELVNSNAFQNLIELLKRTGLADAISLAKVLQTTTDSLRTAQIKLADFYMVLESLAVSELGLNLSNLRAKCDQKREREERSKANELAVQVEMQLRESLEQISHCTDHDDDDDHISDNLFHSVTTAALAATCLLAQVVTCWPVTAPGKCVPELVNWICCSVVKSRNNVDGGGNVGLNTLASSNATQHLQTITEFVAEQARGRCVSNVCHPKSISELIQTILEVGVKCRKQMFA